MLYTIPFLKQKIFLDRLNIKRLCSNNKHFYTYPSEKITYKTPINYNYYSYYPSEKNTFNIITCCEPYKSATFIPLPQLISNINSICNTTNNKK